MKEFSSMLTNHRVILKPCGDPWFKVQRIGRGIHGVTAGKKVRGKREFDIVKILYFFTP